MVGKFAIAGVSFAAMVALGGGAFAQTTEPTPVTVTTVDYVYDAHGTPTEITKTTVGGGETHVSKVTNTVSNDEANWLIGRITQSVETRTTPDNTTASRTTAYSYHGNTHLIATETVEPGDATLEVVTQYGRDSFGNVTSQTVSTVGETARTASMIWSTDGRFMLSQTNGLNHTVAYEYNTALGTVTKETDANGLITAYEYDGFGRLTRQVNADGTEIVRSYDLCADITGCPVAALERIEEQHIVTATGDAVGPVVRTYLDELGRDFMMESQAADGTVTYQETVFDTFGRVIRKSRPYFAGDLPVWADTAYDVLDRVVMVTEENGAVTQTAYDGLTVTVTTPLLETESRQMDALGRLALVTDTMNGTVSYGYDAFGNLTSTTDAMGNVVQMFYDQLGNKTGMVDPDMGSWSYVYNGFGELVSQTDAKNQTVTLGYDVLGRMTQRVEAEGTSTWSYDTAANGIGMVDTVSGPGGQDALGAAQTYSESHSYDALGRPSATTRTIRNENYTTSLSYDAGSRLETVTYPTGFKVAYDYTATGYLNEITNDGTGASLWQAVERDAEGQVVSSDLGNGLTEYTDRDALGRVTGRTLSNGTLGIQLDLAMTYDIAGNLTVREDSVQNRHESFAYDALNRLSNTTLTDTEYSQEISQTSYQYDILGNITYKSDVTGGGAMTYGAGGRPHAVATARGGQTFSYDDNGNVLFDGDRNYAWTSFNKPSLVTKLTASTVTHTSFVYGPDRSRIRQKIVENSITKEVAYIGSYYERRTVVDGNGDTAGVDTHLHYIRADDASLAIHKIEIAQDTTQTEKTLWYSMDHIGSVVLTTDVIGNVSEAMSYDAHGARREATWESALLSIRPVDTPRGFTGHEHLDAVGII
ncbi:MAG: hypothetical protein RIF31_08015, partial [Thalassospira sp.]|uniref:hypothetical protein n=1 Tax=Thalassospira sp. TaxID=1912094 RepID=UPI0032EEE77F